MTLNFNICKDLLMKVNIITDFSTKEENINKQIHYK